MATNFVPAAIIGAGLLLLFRRPRSRAGQVPGTTPPATHAVDEGSPQPTQQGPSARANAPLSPPAPNAPLSPPAPNRPDESTAQGAAQALAAYYGPPNNGRDRTRIAALQRAMGVAPADGIVGPHTTTFARTLGVTIDSAQSLSATPTGTAPAEQTTTTATMTPATNGASDPASRVYEHVTRRRVDDLISTIQSDHGTVTGSNPWTIDTHNHGVMLRAAWDEPSQRLTVTITDKAFYVTYPDVWERVDPMLGTGVAVELRTASGVDGAESGAVALSAADHQRIARRATSAANAKQASRQARSLATQAKAAARAGNREQARALARQARAAAHRSRGHAATVRSIRPAAIAVRPAQHAARRGQAPARPAHPAQHATRRRGVHGDDDPDDTTTPPDGGDVPDWQTLVAPVVSQNQAVLASRGVTITPTQLGPPGRGRFLATQSDKPGETVSFYSEALHHAQLSQSSSSDADAADKAASDADADAGTDTSAQAPPADMPQPDAPPPSDGGGDDGGDVSGYAGGQTQGVNQLRQNTSPANARRWVETMQRQLAALGNLPLDGFTASVIDDRTAQAIESLLGPREGRTSRWLPWSAYLDSSQPVTSRALQSSLYNLLRLVPADVQSGARAMSAQELADVRDWIANAAPADIVLIPAMQIVDGEYRRRFGRTSFAELLSSRQSPATLTT